MKDPLGRTRKNAVEEDHRDKDEMQTMARIKVMLSIRVVIISVALIAPNLKAQTAVTDQKIKEEIQNLLNKAYVEAVFNTGSLDDYRAGFSEAFQMFYLENDSVKSIGFKDWERRITEGIAEKRYPRPKDKRVRIEITDWHLTPQAANVVLYFYYGNQRAYQDFISLYKVDGTWEIVSKCFQKL